MNSTCKLLTVALAAVALFSLDFHAQSTAATELNLGVEALKQSGYAEAVQHLEKAVSLDPENQNARMYLAKAYLGIASVDMREMMVPQELAEGAKLGLIPNPSKTPDQKKACDDLKAKYAPTIKEGIDSLNKAMKLGPGDHDAVQMMEMMYMAKAATDCDDPAAREEDQKSGAAWFGKREFGVPVESRESSVGDFDKQLYPVCQSPGESTGSGEPYDVAEAYEVYSAIIPTVDPNPKTRTWLIRIDTLPINGSLRPEDPSGGAREEWKQARGQRPADTALDDYLRMNARTWLLQKNFTLPKPYKLVTHDEIQAMFPHPGGFGEPWIELSAVGFNADRTMAVVYMAHYCAVSCGGAGGKSFLLQKHNGKWEVLTGVECWMS
jgi:hypothetical protein